MKNQPSSPVLTQRRGITSLCAMRFFSVLTALSIRFKARMHKFHPAESHRGIREGPDGQGRDWAAASGGSSRLGVAPSFPGTGAAGSSAGRSLQVESVGCDLVSDL